jgi:hypothetical protein
MKRKFSFNLFLAIAATAAFLVISCSSETPQQIDWSDVYPVTQTAPLDIGAKGVKIYRGSSSGNQRLPGSQYGYEIWSAGNSPNTKLTWYGPYQGGGAAFKAEWANSGNFIGRVGYYWGNGGDYKSYNNIYCGYNFKKTGSDGNFSYIGVYGWSRSPLVEYYIVEDSFRSMPLTPYGTSYKGEFTVDGAVYKIYQGTRTNQPSIDGTKTFPQVFSVRQTARTAGVISVTEHFKQWEKLGVGLGKSMYEAKFKVEVGGGSGSLDMTFLTFYRKDD